MPDSAPAPVPWYAFTSTSQGFSKATWRFLAVAGVILLGCLVTVKPLWQLGWRHHVICAWEFYAVKSASGKTFPGGGWVRGREIRVYGAPGVTSDHVLAAADGLASLVKELGLHITVKAVPPSADALASLQAAVKQTKNGPAFDLDTFIDRRLDDRGQRFAEMIVVKQPFTDPDWAWGLTRFPEGVAALQEERTDPALGRHEGAHLLGYDKHDDMPWYILGYPEDPIPDNRDTLMMLLQKKSDALSARARDALHYFWLGEEEREKMRFF